MSLLGFCSKEFVNGRSGQESLSERRTGQTNKSSRLRDGHSPVASLDVCARASGRPKKIRPRNANRDAMCYRTERHTCCVRDLLDGHRTIRSNHWRSRDALALRLRRNWRNPLDYWADKCLAGQPSLVPHLHYATRKMILLGRFLDDHSPVRGIDPPIAPRVSRLNNLSGPSAIVRTIWAVVLDAIQRVAFARARPHVVDKRNERFVPTVTDGNPPGAVVSIHRVGWILAALAHGYPRVVLRRTNVSMFGVNLDGSPRRRAPTTLDIASEECGPPNHALVPANASTAPIGDLVFAFWMNGQKDPSMWQRRGENFGKIEDSHSSNLSNRLMGGQGRRDVSASRRPDKFNASTVFAYRPLSPASTSVSRGFSFGVQ